MLRIATGSLAFLLVAATRRGSERKGTPVKELMPWYHSTDEIRRELTDIVAACSKAGLEATLTESGPLDVLRIKQQYVVATTKAVLVFGEHARELISPESGLDLASNLCSRGGASSGLARETLRRGVEFVLIPNANPKARRLVEDGYYCKRTNENQVDLNRNWGDEHRDARGNQPGDDQNPGPRGFSEPETQALRDIVENERPDIFLSIHSGAYLLGAPYGYTFGKPQNQAAFNEVLRPISKRFCGGDCPYGSLADMIGYANKGCDIDWVSDHVGVPYAFTWEIYAGWRYRVSYIHKAQLQNSLNLQQRKASRGLRALSGTSLEGDSELPDQCIEQFLPTTKEEAQKVIENWTGAYLDLANVVANKK